MEVYIGCLKKLVALHYTWQSSTSQRLCLAQEVMLSSGALQSSSSCCSLWGPTRKDQCSCSVQAPTHTSDKKATGVQPGLILTWNQYLIRLSTCPGTCTENSNAWQSHFYLCGEGTVRSTCSPKHRWWIPVFSLLFKGYCSHLDFYWEKKKMNKLNVKKLSWKSTLSFFPGFTFIVVIVQQSKSKCSDYGLKELHSVGLIDQVIVPHCLVSYPSSDNWCYMPILCCYGKQISFGFSSDFLVSPL